MWQKKQSKAKKNPTSFNSLNFVFLYFLLSLSATSPPSPKHQMRLELADNKSSFSIVVW